MKYLVKWLAILIVVAFLFYGCEKQPEVVEKKLRVGMVLDTGGDQDRGFNEYSLKGARDAAAEIGIDFAYVASESTTVYERNVEEVIAEGADLIFTVGFALANATAKAALRYPDRHFVIMDYAFSPGNGCSEDVDNCYTQEGRLANVTSLVFAEDQPSFIAGALAGCMSKTGVIGAVAGYEIPPVVRFVEGFELGARWVRPDIVALKKYIPDFNDSATGHVVASDFISKGADVLFCPGGTTGLGGLRAAKEAGVMAVGVDVDQYLTYPEAGSAIITSVMKKVDIAAGATVKAFGEDRLKPGIQSFSLRDNGVGLAPYHEWEEKIPEECKVKVEEAKKRLQEDSSISLKKSIGE